MIRDNYLDVKRITTDPEVLKIFKIIRHYGGIIRFVGGAVRDALMGLKAANIDLSTDLSPDELAEACEEAGIRTMPIGLKIDTLGVVVGNTLLEISSLKKQVKNSNGRMEVEFTDDWKEDASKRDLTINAVYADENGNVFDYYNGIKDLEKGNIRFIGDANRQIREDYVRILRFFRFYSLFGKTPIDARALKACREHINGLKSLPIERIRDELLKILLTPKAAATLGIMFENDILSHWLIDSPYLNALEKLIRLEAKYGFAPDPTRRLFALFRPNKMLAENIAIRLKLPKKQKEYLIRLAEAECAEWKCSSPAELKQAVYRFGKDTCLSVLLLREAAAEKDESQAQTIFCAIQDTAVPIFPISGKDIIGLGITGNAQIGATREQLEQIWINSGFELTRDELLAKITS